MSTIKNESYYKILGTTANIGQARIEEKYLEALEKHPLETDPETYNKIQEAYDVLKDPEKRAAYDEARKSNKNKKTQTKQVETDAPAKAEQHHIKEAETEANDTKQPNEAEQLIIDAKKAMDNEDNQTAFELYKKINQLVPDSGEVKFKLLKLASLNDDVDEMEKVFSEILPLAASDEELQMIYNLKAGIYRDNSYFDKAIETYEQLFQMFPEQTVMFVPALADLYIQTGQSDKAMQLMEQSQPREEDTKTITSFYLSWINLIITTEKWSLLSKVISKFKKHIKHISDDVEQNQLKNELMEQYRYFHQEALFQEAEIYTSLADALKSPENDDIKQAHQETKKQAQLQKDIRKLFHDKNVHQLLYYKAYEWFYTGKIAPAKIMAVTKELPISVRQQLESDKENYAAGIMQLKKKYPFIYKSYQDKWNNLFEQLTAGLSRQEKRKLGKKK
ncbi:J domain-containing protein [Oceanobacillus locisalsi]|uniref:DnaJ domain-containing protein n=1 Tax=Oceanobacillus locisalsi TaxID=546107 RepID=A0ABW3NK91_9BACI